MSVSLNVKCHENYQLPRNFVDFMTCYHLSVHVSVPAVVAPVGEVHPGVSSEGEAVVVDVDVAGGPVGRHDEDLAVVLHGDAAQALGQRRAGGQQAQAAHQQQLHGEVIL